MSSDVEQRINLRRQRSRLRTIPARDRDVVTTIEKWIHPIPWQWFITLTFPWEVREETAMNKLRQFANELERFARTSVCFVGGRESRSKKTGMSVPHHFHLLLVSRGVVTAEDIGMIWRGLVARRRSELSRYDCIKVESYDPDARGAKYCLKQLTDDYGEWITHRLGQFLPGLPGPSRPNHRTVRNARRAKAQADRNYRAKNPSDCANPQHGIVCSRPAHGGGG